MDRAAAIQQIRENGRELVRPLMKLHQAANALDHAETRDACLAAGLAPGDGFVLLTSRCSYELVEKTAAFGAATLVALAAPTTLAVSRAAALGITLLAPARADFALCFAP